MIRMIFVKNMIWTAIYIDKVDEHIFKNDATVVGFIVVLVVFY